jgi:hypothetical protein
VGQQRPLGEVCDFIGEVSFTALEGLEERISFRWGNGMGRRKGGREGECGLWWWEFSVGERELLWK